MKTSTKLFIAAITTLIILLVIYDFGLKAEYMKGSATYVGAGKEISAHKDFDRVKINSAGVVKVMIVPGDYKIEVSPESAIDVTTSQTGKLLTLDINFLDKEDYYSNKRAVYIYVPKLKELTTDSKYTIHGKSYRNRKVKGSKDVAVVVQGFANTYSLDSLTLLQDNASTVTLTGNKIGFLKSITGVSAGSRSALNIFAGNQIQSASFEARGSSFLTLENVAITKVQFQASDSAQVNLSGASSLALLKK
jgi:hypothetical protein